MESPRLLLLTVFLLACIGLILAFSLGLFQSDVSLDSLSSAPDREEETVKKSLADADSMEDVADATTEEPDSQTNDTSDAAETTHQDSSTPSTNDVRYLITGKIFGPDGKALANARIAGSTSFWGSNFKSSGFHTQLRIQADKYAVGTTFLSQQDGSFRIQFDTLNANYIACRIPVEFDDFSRGYIEADFSHQFDKERKLLKTTANVTLQQGYQMSGLVLMPDGSPAAGANITVFLIPIKEEEDESENDVQFITRNRNTHRQPEQVNDAITEEDGQFLLNMKPGDYRLAVEHENAAVLISKTITVTEQGTGELVLSLFEGAKLSGDIRDENGNVIVASLILSRRWDDPINKKDPDAIAMMEEFRQSNTISEDGSFVLEHIQSGYYEFLVSSNNYITKHIKVEVTKNEIKTLDIILNSGFQVTVRVLDENGSPLKDARVTLQSTDWESEERASSGGNSNESGEFIATTLNPGQYRLSAFLIGYLQKSYDVQIRGEETLDIRLQLSPKLLVQAQDVETGIFLSSYTINMIVGNGFQSYVGEDFPVENMSDPFGFELATNYSSLSITASGYPESSPVRIGKENLNSDQVLIVPMLRGGGVSGRLLSATGDPLEGAQVIVVTASQAQSLLFSMTMRVYDEDWEDSGSNGKTDTDGRFELSHVHPGENLVVVAFHTKYPTAKKERISIQPGTITDVGTLHTPKGASLQGHVFDNDGLPQPGMNVKAMNLSGGDGKSAITDDQGFYKIESITPGNIMAGLEDGPQEIIRQIELKDGESATLDFGGKRGNGKVTVHMTVDGELFHGNMTMIPMYGFQTQFITLLLKDDKYTSPPLEDGAYILWAGPGAGKTPIVEKTFIIRAGRSVEHTADIHTGDLVLEISDEAGQLIPDLNIIVFSRSTPRYRSWLKSIGTLSPSNLLPDSSNHYTIQNLPQGEHDFVISAPGYKSELVTRFPISAQGNNQYQTRLQKIDSPGAIKVSLLDEDGHPSSTMMVMSLCTRGGTPLYRSHLSMQDAMGNVDHTYVIPSVPAGSYVLKLSPITPGPSQAQEVTIQAGLETKLTLIETKIGSLQVQVLNVSGSALQDAEIKLVNEFNHELTFRFYLTAMKILPTFTDSDGQWGFQHLAPGSYKITAINSRGKRITETINIQSGQETAITLQIP